MSGSVRVGRRTIEISHPEKALFARPESTKLQLADYYARVSEAMVPLVAGRPLALQVYPGGIEGHGFFMKSAPAHFPSWIARATVAKKGGSVSHVVADDAATLVYLAGQNAITPHTSISIRPPASASRPCAPRPGRPAPGFGTPGSCPT
jgi:bifunctional non-homologous end joining protein LigD